MSVRYLQANLRFLRTRAKIRKALIKLLHASSIAQMKVVCSCVHVWCCHRKSGPQNCSAAPQSATAT